METETPFQDPCKQEQSCLARIHTEEHLSSRSQQSLLPAVRWSMSVVQPERVGQLAGNEIAYLPDPIPAALLRSPVRLIRNTKWVRKKQMLEML